MSVRLGSGEGEANESGEKEPEAIPFSKHGLYACTKIPKRHERGHERPHDDQDGGGREADQDSREYAIGIGGVRIDHFVHKYEECNQEHAEDKGLCKGRNDWRNERSEENRSIQELVENECERECDRKRSRPRDAGA